MTIGSYLSDLNQWRLYLWMGVFTTVTVTLTAIALALLVGIVIASLQVSRLRSIRIAARIYVETMRGIPVLGLLFLLFFGLPNIGIILSPFEAGVLGLGLSAGAYASEIIRAGILEVPRGVREAGAAIALPPLQVASLIVLPIALRKVLPPLTTLAVTVTKDSSMVSTIAVADLMLQTQNIASANLRGLEVYLTTAAVYVVLTIPLIVLGQSLERRFSYTTRVGALIRTRRLLASAGFDSVRASRESET